MPLSFPLALLLSTQSFGSWVYEEATDPITDQMSGAIQATSDNGKAKLIVACDKTQKNRPMTIQLVTDQFIGSSRGTVIDRINAESPSEERWDFGGKRAMLFDDYQVWSFVRRLYRANTVFMRVYDYNGAIVDNKFTLSGTNDALAKVTQACGQPDFAKRK